MSDPFQVEDSFFQAGGNLLPDSPSYVTREADHELLGLTLAGEYCNVLTARQTGKSSLMVRTRERLHGKSVHTVVIDLSIVGSQEITADEWYFGLVSAIRRQLELGIDERRWWEEREQLSPVQRFSDFLKEVVLRRVPGPIIIFIDEIDSTLSLSFTDDFFVAIRAMYNERARNPENKRLTFVLVGVALPADLIKRRRRTPYNIGQTVDLKDFTSQNASGFLPGLELACPGQSEAILERVLYWTGGHPYLTQRVCVAVVEERGEGWSDERVDQLVVRLFFQEGRIREETNLQWIDDYVRGSKYRGGMLQVYGAIISGQEVRDEERSIEKSQLKLSGLVRATSEGYLQVRSRIYGHVFGPEWVDSARPGIAWSKVVFSALAAMLLIAIAMVAYRYVVDKSSTPTPGPSPSFTTTQAAVIVPTSTPLPSETDTPTSTSTSTATPVDTKITTRVYTDTPTPTGTLSPSSTPKATRTATGTPSPSSTATATPTMPTPTPIVIVVTATPTLAPGLAPPPVLVEPEAGTTFSKVVRLKWNWHRRLEDYERFAIRWEPVSGQTVGDWWVSEGGIIDGGGAIHSVEDGYRFEVNVGLDPYPEGEANWSVAVFQDPSKVQVSQWSERRQIGKGTPTPIVPKPGSYITATTGSAIFVGPDTDSEILGLVGVGESVEVIGRVSWGRWAYVHSDREDVEGFVWGPYFGWHEKEAWESLPIIPTPTPTPTPTFEPLVILRPESMPFCTDDGGKMAGVQVFVQGGDGNYTFFWEDEKVSATELEEAGSYLVFWSWGSFSQVGTLTVVSGDGQRASQGDIWLSEATCSP